MISLHDIDTLVFIATASLAIGTFILAFFTKKTANEMTRTRKETNQANVMLYFKEQNNILYLVVKNFGDTEARNVKIYSNPPIENSKGYNYDSLFESMLSNFPPGYEVFTFFDVPINYIKKFGSNFPRYGITIEFDDIYNEHHIQECDMDLRYIQNIEFLGSEEDSIESSMNTIAAAVDNSILRVEKLKEDEKE
ncbi:hypothetical protein MBCUT_03670 [Methanobrevibacter cuticularis]|uniref:Uncharacterized protein n=1 Tax=Methanobrevibacter cuticularis TaxID=47311 RepID=A0A166EY97_9EURY|nr:hypothetical protein [Methanobrevibacter cuticularis]KZX17135.1 hypothetical protein MBCUT_03670 [Methanobrevibacter cuticularis]